jgi:hypothetical protein
VPLGKQLKLSFVEADGEEPLVLEAKGVPCESFSY